jgi:hypothetical protein
MLHFFLYAADVVSPSLHFVEKLLLLLGVKLLDFVHLGLVSQVHLVHSFEPPLIVENFVQIFAPVNAAEFLDLGEQHVVVALGDRIEDALVVVLVVVEQVVLVSFATFLFPDARSEFLEPQRTSLG